MMWPPHHGWLWVTPALTQLLALHSNHALLLSEYIMPPALPFATLPGHMLSSLSVVSLLRYKRDLARDT